ncbi:MAG: 3-phosphoshikimate 1-carboxyvinyltransferase [Tissierellia bacterium]|nr:3-phosphoshikimate 1-carboxyvinyltransferase [Tissierellia bacterium]
MKINSIRKGLVGEITVPGDKSISHRSIIISSLSTGNSIIENLLESEDVERTIEAFKNMGVNIIKKNNKYYVEGVGLKGLEKPKKPIDCGNSGTTARLLSGVLVGQKFDSIIVGDESLSMRPMDRIILPLSKMGAKIKGRMNKHLPICISPSQDKLKSINYELPVASAQVKSAILLATLYATGKTSIIENKVTRDHTERMLEYFGCNVYRTNNVIYVDSNSVPVGKKIYVPGDISSASYFIVAATIIEGSNLTIRNVGINPTRSGIITVLRKMGADIKIVNKRELNNEPVGDIVVKHAPLKGIVVDEQIIGTLIDEIPILAVAASLSEGTTVIKDAEELKYKESNRLETIYSELKKMGANIKMMGNDLIIEGVKELNAGKFDSYNDHRMAMALSIAALKGNGQSEILGYKSVNISFPSFYKTLYSLC